MKSRILRKITEMRGGKACHLVDPEDAQMMGGDAFPGASGRVNATGASHPAYGKKGMQYLYKYMTVDVAARCLDEGVIRFSQPTAWPDKYEQRFYEADYRNVTGGLNDKDITPRFLACCFTTNKMSEASWKTYSYGKQGFGNSCVKLKLSKTGLRESIVGNDCVHRSYEGFMNYSLSDYEILNLHRAGCPCHAEVFRGGEFGLRHYLSLMLLKRQAFYYEGEYRYMVVKDPDDNEPLEETRDLKVDWASVIRGVEVGEDCLYAERLLLRGLLEKSGVDMDAIGGIGIADLYEPPDTGIVVEK